MSAKSKPNSILEAASKNPSVALRAFAPEVDYILTMDAWMLLEALESPYVSGGKLQMRDTMVLLLAMTDTDTLFAAKRKGPDAVEDLLRAAGRTLRPQAVMDLRPKIEAAIDAAFDPLPPGEAEKKSSAAPVGGSPSST
ncbi:MAG: hypothetical protein ABIS50_15110 [Luteolibacter sp.]|uniref:hypothetical protein n=1 Tax=Luteolibacter sp. TaxID=1962973 RepID=UPI003266150E